jgi:hypothetical protein
MSRLGEALEVHTVTFHPPSDSWLGSARHLDMRMELAEVAIDAASGGSTRPMLVFPAGFLRAASEESRDGVAAALLERAAAADVGVAFGIDLGRDEDWAPIAGPPRSFGYASDGGRPRLWPGELVRSQTGKRGLAARVFELCGRRVGLVLSGEIFNVPLKQLLATQRPELILHLTHVGPNERWREARAELESLAPVVITGGPPIEPAPLWAQRASGWVVEAIAETRSMSLYRHRRITLDARYADDESQPARS